MPKIIHIIRHEFKLAAANKAYVILTILGPFLIFAVTVLPSLVTTHPGSFAGDKPIALLGASPPARAALEASYGGMGMKLVDAVDEASAKADVLAGKDVGFLSIEAGWPDSGKAVWYSKTGAEAALFGNASSTLSAVARRTRIAASGIDPALIASVLAEPSFEVVKLEAGGKEKTKTQDAFLQVLFTAMSFIMLLYMTVLLYGQLIGRSVVTEKTSKTVEVMLSSVTSRDLMFGKILGLGLAGLLQYGVWVGMAMVLIKLVGPALGITLPQSVSPGNLVWLVVFFVLAFFLYSSAYAALGAASEDEQHLGQLAWPLLLFLIVPLVMIGSLVTNPESTVAVVLSIFPMTSPIVMLLRNLVSPPAFWQIALSLVLLVLSVGGMALFAAKILGVGFLMTGMRPKLGEIARWLSVK